MFILRPPSHHEVLCRTTGPELYQANLCQRVIGPGLSSERLGERTSRANPQDSQQLVTALVSLFRPFPHLSELLDEALFNGATFNDLVSSNQRPIIFIHASDMATVSRFEFNQRQFDLIFSDLSKLPLSIATASSTALPIWFVIAIHR